MDDEFGQRKFDEVEQRSFTGRALGIDTTRLYRAIQEHIPETAVRLKTHSKKSNVSVQGKTSSDRLNDSKEQPELKDQQKSGKGVSGILKAAYKIGVDEDIDERVTSGFKRYDRKSKKPASHESVGFKQSLNARGHLSALEATAAIAVFDKIVDQLAVLKKLLPQCSVKEVLQGYQSIKERFAKEESGSEPNLEEKPLNEDLEKLQRDRTFIEEVLLKITEELEKKNNFWALYSVVIDKLRMDRDEEELVENWPAVRNRLREVRAELRQTTEMLAPQALARALVSLKQQDELADTMMLLAAEERYVNQWEAARQAQQSARNKLRERTLRKAVRQTATSFNAESSAIQKARLLLTGDEERLERDVILWETRRNMDVDQINDTLLKAKDTLDAARSHNEDMRKQVTKRDMELEMWRANKKEMLRWQNAARCVQKNWRAYVYRRTVALAMASMRRGRLVLLNVSEQFDNMGRASVRERVRLAQDREKYHQETYVHAFIAILAAVGSKTARRVLEKQAMALRRKGKGGKGGKGKGRKGRK